MVMSRYATLKDSGVLYQVLFLWNKGYSLRKLASFASMRCPVEFNDRQMQKCLTQARKEGFKARSAMERGKPPIHYEKPEDSLFRRRKIK